MLRNNKNPAKLSLVFFLVDKKLKKNKLIFFFRNSVGSLKHLEM